MSTPAAATPTATPATPPPAAPPKLADRLQAQQGAAGVIATARAKAIAASATSASAAPAPVDPLSGGAPPPKTAAQLSAEAGTPPAADQSAKPPADGKPAAGTAEIDADAAALKLWAKLQRENRELQAKLKEMEPAGAAAKTLTDAKKLWAEGKKIDAVALLAGSTDPTAEMDALLADYLKGPGAQEITAADLAKQIAEDKAREKAAADAKAKEDEAKAAETARTEATKQATAYVESVVAKAAEKYPLAGKPENRAKVAEMALAGVQVLQQVRKIDPATMTPEATNALIEEAIEEVEVEYMLEAQRETTRAQLRERVSKGTLQTGGAEVQQTSSQRFGAADSGRREQPEAGNRAPTIDSSMSRPGVSPNPPRRFYTHAEAAERARRSASGQ